MAERNLRALSSGLIPDDFILPEGRLLLAFSGGEDSLFLMALLAAAAPERSMALYVNHGIRERKELEREEELNARNASALGIPLVVRRIPSGEVRHLASEKDVGLEAAARELRYSILRSYAEKNGFDHILTAHHLDDQAETILMRILSLSPLYRFEGIRRERGRIFRPFLSIEKELINAYVAEENLLYSTDTTNSDVRYMRNYIRTFLLPHMSIENKRLLSSIALNMQVINKRSLPVRMKKGFSFMMGRLDFLSSTPLRKEEVFYEVNRAFGFSSLFPRSECLEAERAIREKRSFVCSRFYLRTENDEVRFFPPHVNIVLDASKSFTWNNLSYLVDDPECDDKTLRIDFSAISFPLILRESREGDSIELKEGRKKIKDLEKEYRVPYCFILEDRISIVAVFCRLFGKRDRIAKRLLGLSGKACSLKETKTD